MLQIFRSAFQIGKPDTSQAMAMPGDPSDYPLLYELDLEDEGTENLIEEFTDIISNAAISEVEQALVNYVASNIEPVGWTAIWKAKRGSHGLQSNCDFLVEVTNVSVNALEADIRILTVLSDLPGVNVAEVVPIAPLLDLYPSSEDDPEGNFFETALVIEHVRFFYNHIWKPWDDADDEIEKFVFKIRPRVELYMDIAAGQVDDSTKIKVQRFLQEGQQIRRALETLKVSTGLNSGDPDLELDPADVKQMVEFTERLEALSRAMDIIENRQLRLCMVQEQFVHHPQPARRPGILVMHVVAAEFFSFAHLKSLGVADDIALEFHYSLGHAISASQERDQILLLPGIHTCAGLPWIDKDITVEGAGDRENTVLTPTDVGDVFINCSTSRLKLRNITVKVTRPMQCVLMVHSGVVMMENCHIDGGSATVPITVLNNAELHMTDCEVETAQGNDIDVRPGGVLKVLPFDGTVGNENTMPQLERPGAENKGKNQEPPVAARNMPLDANANIVDG